MPNPRRLTHSRGTSWEITCRVEGRMVRQRFATRALAVSALARARAAALDGLGITPADGKTTLAEYAPRWLAAQQCRPSTLAMYDSHVRNHIVPMLGRRPMATLRRSDISAFVVALTKKQLATATVVTIYRVLAMILRSAVYDRLLAASPATRSSCRECRHVGCKRSPPSRSVPCSSTCRHATTPSSRSASAPGMRQGEVLGLTLPHLRLLARELSVEQQCRVVPGGPKEITPELKTQASRRVLPLPQFVVTALARHVELYGLGPEQTVFFSPRGGLWRRGSFNETVWKPALMRAGLPRQYGFHALRHTYASSLISAGLHPRVIQARLGHKSIVETMDTYGHLFPDANEETTRVLEAHYSAALLRRTTGT